MTQKTVQLRRYRLAEGMYDDFIAWWRDSIPAVRTALGFTVEYAYGLRDTNEFVWAVSAPGGAEDFARLEEVYLASDERASAFRGQPSRVFSQENRIADFVWQG